MSYPERFSDDAVDLLTAIFKVNPEERFTLRECIEHPWTNDGYTMCFFQVYEMFILRYEIDPSYQGSMQEVTSDFFSVFRRITVTINSNRAKGPRNKREIIKHIGAFSLQFKRNGRKL